MIRRRWQGRVKIRNNLKAGLQRRPPAGPLEYRLQAGSRLRSPGLGLFRLRVLHDQEHGMPAGPLAGAFAADQEIVCKGPLGLRGVLAEEPEQDAVPLPARLGPSADDRRDLEQLPTPARLELVGRE